MAKQAIYVDLTEEDLALIQRRLDSGEFASVDQLLDAAVHNLLHDEYDEAGLLSALPWEIDAALDDPAPRTTLDTTFNELREHMAQVAEAYREKLAG